MDEPIQPLRVAMEMPRAATSTVLNAEKAEEEKSAPDVSEDNPPDLLETADPPPDAVPAAKTRR